MAQGLDIDWTYAIDAIPLLLEGAKLTVVITFFGLIIGFVIGVLTGLARGSDNKLIKGIATGYVEVIRGTPIMVQALYIYFAIPQLLGVDIPSLNASIAAIAINSGAYIAEVVRGSVQSIDRGQVEAGRSLGLSRIQTFYHVVWPQAFKRMIPPLGNQFIISLKDTSLLAVIGVGELTRQGQIAVANNFRAFEIWTAVGVIYLAITLSLTFVLRRMERRLNVR
ncbi:amino acid ABC transporter membrane protein (PAAT family) [Melghirimyces profundicolus]|uniref:Amino acid ABC transporter membrane protein (PAAT family) n=1 Tax=Melghirimyces profundicolus TaxID=1242148 RepID=A0A2T6C0H7_9BACL|nr:ABC transporter permease subunit [Melghirimyces profundicolus]PTX61811.1 amino acid ABC transporter membrane protein (PAAT family) [Melghirimyces profundicolus]